MIVPESMARKARVHKPKLPSLNPQQFVTTTYVDPALQKSAEEQAVASSAGCAMACCNRMARLT